MLNGPFSPWPCYDQEEKDAVMRVMDSNRVNYWTGQEGREFEKEFARYTQTEYAIAVANGTVALDLAWHALDLPAGSEVIVTSRSFIASVSSIVLAGLTPVFADVNPDTQNIDENTIREKITDKTSAICCVHLAGWPCDMESIMGLADEFALKVVEDCAQAHGAEYRGKPVGGWGHIAGWSFCQDKIMTTAGEGGMLTTNDKELWSRAWSFKDHGKAWEAVYERDHPPGFRWLHESFGTNWRMTETQAAVGRIQVARMPSWTAKRTEYSHRIFDTCRKFGALRVPEVPEDIKHAYYKCYVFVEPEKLQQGWDRDRVIQAISERGVPCFSGSCSEIYLEKAFDNTGFRPEKRSQVAKRLSETSLMFMVHPTLTDQEIAKTCDAIAQVMAEAS